jgi:RNA polymerase sigma factor (sigma-70 family)
MDRDTDTDTDTDIGGRSDRFPLTRHSIVAGTRSNDADVRRRAHADLVAAYWKPIYKYLRVKWRQSNEDAKDLTQGFLARAIAKGFFGDYDPRIARFRTYLRTCLDRYVANQQKAARRLKRGGGVEFLSLDFERLEGELTREVRESAGDVEEFFHREWIRSLFSVAVANLREELAREGKGIHYELFHRYDLEGPELNERPTYDDLAQEYGLPVTQVTNHLALARRRFRRIVLDRLRAMSGSEEEYREEARELLGFDPQ